MGRSDANHGPADGRIRWRRAAALTTALVGIALLVTRYTGSTDSVVATCHATTPTGVGSYLVTPEQAVNAATIASVGRRAGLVSHAVTVALATAFQESHLHNLPYGDRDSLWLFQQRPSQGWGTPEQILQPRLASASFYSHLAKVPGWADLPVTDAAQAVQRSAAPQAYAQWEDPARALARALTGEVPAGLSCTLPPGDRPAAAAAVLALAAQDLGPQALQRGGSTAATDWAEASWVVAHAQELFVRAVSCRGRTWTADSGRWQTDPAAAAVGVSFH